MDGQPTGREAAAAWHTLPAEAVLAQLASDAAQGLSAAEAAARRVQYGPNMLIRGRRRSLLVMLLGQFADFMILVLLAAAVISGVVGEPPDTIAILVIVLLNAVIGAVQEYRAERAVAALRQMAAPEAQVVRDGAAGHRAGRQSWCPATSCCWRRATWCRPTCACWRSAELQADESALTGESHAGGQAASRRWTTTSCRWATGATWPSRARTVTPWPRPRRGRWRPAWTPRSAASPSCCMARRAVKTPLQQRLTRFGRYLALAVLAICAIVFVAGLLQGQPLLLMFLTAVSLAVAAIPEALPAVVTISLALGARKLVASQRPGAQPAGGRDARLGHLHLLRQDRHPDREPHDGGALRAPAATSTMPLPQAAVRAPLARAGAGAGPEQRRRRVQDGAAAGEPTELALYRGGAGRPASTRRRWSRPLPRVAELPFDSKRKHDDHPAPTRRRRGGLRQGCAGGRADPCRRRDAMATEPFDAPALLAAGGGAGGRGLPRAGPGRARSCRAARASSRRPTWSRSALPRPGGADRSAARRRCRRRSPTVRAAGITPVMITGDHPGTARAIAARLGIVADDATRAHRQRAGAAVRCRVRRSVAESVRRLCPGQPGAEDPHRQGAAGARRVRRHDRRRRQRRPGAEARRHRRRHGPEGHRRGARGGRHGAAGRQLRHHRRARCARGGASSTTSASSSRTP